VHFFWPGFITTNSGVNENGVYVMKDYSSSRPGQPARNISMETLMQREVLRRAKSLLDVPQTVAAFTSDQGGVCSNGCNIVFAQPSDFRGDAEGVTQRPSAMVYEGDRVSGVFRLPGKVPPLTQQGIMATNHFLELGVDPLEPLNNFGSEVYFSSLWRYEAGRRLVDVYTHYSQPVGTTEMKRLLQTVTHGTTEHSLIVRPDLMLIDIAIADLRGDGGWHAPYLNWTTSHFEDFFSNRKMLLM